MTIEDPTFAPIYLSLPVAGGEEIRVQRETAHAPDQAEIVVRRLRPAIGGDVILGRFWTPLMAVARALRWARQIDDDDLRRVCGEAGWIASEERQYRETLARLGAACRGRRIVGIWPEAPEARGRSDETAVVVALEGGRELRFGDEGPGNRFGLVDRLERVVEAGGTEW